MIRIGRQISLDEESEAQVYKLVVKAAILKFQQNPILLEKLKKVKGHIYEATKSKRFMFKKKDNLALVVNRGIRTRRHDDVVFETCRPNLEIYKTGSIYRGVLEWNNVHPDLRNIVQYVKFKEIQKQEMYDFLPNINGSHF